MKSYLKASVVDRIAYKVNHDFNTLSKEERCRLEEMLIDYYAKLMFEKSDEELMQEACDKGVII